MNNIIRTEETHPLTWRLRNDQKTVWIKEYCKKNGYFSLKKALKTMSPEDIVHLIKESGLKGRGGAGFSTGLKWSLMSQNKSSKVRYLLCNADEMEPGTYKDRLLLEQLPHQLLEGMIISGFAIEATMAYIFLRGEYISAENNLKKAIIEAENCGYLGRNILGSDFTFKISEVRLGYPHINRGESHSLIHHHHSSHFSFRSAH